MKLRLPKELLALTIVGLVSVSHEAKAESFPQRPVYVAEVEADQSIDFRSSEDAIKTNFTATWDQNNAAVVKDGQGSLTITNAKYTTDVTFVAREGETIIKDSTIYGKTATNERLLMVGGYNASPTGDNIGATLTLDNTTYKHPEGHVGYNSSIIIGGADGDGTLILKNESVLANDHCLFAGGQSRSYLDDYTFNHICGTYTGTYGDGRYRDNVENYANFQIKTAKGSGNTASSFERRYSTARIEVIDGSQVLIGQSLLMSNVKIIVSGKDSLISDGNRVVSEDSAFNSRLGDCVWGGTDITVSDGGTWTSRNTLLMSTYGGTDDDGFNGDTKITVGNDGTFNSLMYTQIGGTGAGAKTVMTVESGGIANMTNVTMGFEKDATGDDYVEGATIATINVNKDGIYNGSQLTVRDGAVVSNAGTFNLLEGNMVLAASNGAASKSTTVASLLMIDGGMVNNSGIVTAETVDVTAGQLTNEKDGTLVVNKLTVSDGIVVNKGTISSASPVMTLSLDDVATAQVEETDTKIVIKGGGAFVNDAGATVMKDIDVKGGTLTLGDGSTALGVTMDSGKIVVEGAATTGALTLKGGEIVFDYTTSTFGEALLSVDGDNIILSEKVTITLNLTNDQYEALQTGVKYELFDVADGALEGTANIQFTNTETNQTTTGTFDAATGSAMIPEPTTATLSLLALAALAARRRRK